MRNVAELPSGMNPYSLRYVKSFRYHRAEATGYHTSAIPSLLHPLLVELQLFLAFANGKIVDCVK